MGLKNDISQHKSAGAKGRDEKRQQAHEPIVVVDDTPRVDWTLVVEASEVSEEVLSTWYETTADAIKLETLDAFNSALKMVIPTQAIVSLFRHNKDDFENIDLAKLAIVLGCKPIVECMVTVLGEEKFFEFSRWGSYFGIHLAAIWGHVELVELFHEFHVKKNGDPLAPGTETVPNIAGRYQHSSIVEYYTWFDLRNKYQRLLISLQKHLLKAVPQSEPVFPAEELEKYRAGCEQQLQLLPNVKFSQMTTANLLQRIDEACELRYRAKTFLPKAVVHGHAEKGGKGKKKK